MVIRHNFKHHHPRKENVQHSLKQKKIIKKNHAQQVKNGELLIHSWVPRFDFTVDEGKG